MTKKHFIELADALRASKPKGYVQQGSIGSISGAYGEQLGQWMRDVAEVADFCASQNPHFNRARWLAYIAGECGPNGGKVT